MEMQPVCGKKLLVWQPGSRILKGSDCFDLAELRLSLQFRAKQKAYWIAWCKREWELERSALEFPARGDWIWKMKTIRREGAKARKKLGSWSCWSATWRNGQWKCSSAENDEWTLKEKNLSFLSFKLFSGLFLFFFHRSHLLLPSNLPKSLLTHYLV